MKFSEAIEFTSITREISEMRGRLLCSDDLCDNDASVLVTCADHFDHQLDAEPYCASHAHVLFADWMVGA